MVADSALHFEPPKEAEGGEGKGSGGHGSHGSGEHGSGRRRQRERLVRLAWFARRLARRRHPRGGRGRGRPRLPGQGRQAAEARRAGGTVRRPAHRHHRRRSARGRRGRDRRDADRHLHLGAAGEQPVHAGPSLGRRRPPASLTPMPAPGEPLIVLEDVRKTYHLGEVDVKPLQGVSIVIRQGELVAIQGASGSGKTTLLNLLGCLDRPTSGRYLLLGRDVSQLGRDELARVRHETFGFVFQNFCLPGAHLGAGERGAAAALRRRAAAQAAARALGRDAQARGARRAAEAPPRPAQWRPAAAAWPSRARW